MTKYKKIVSLLLCCAMLVQLGTISIDAKKKTPKLAKTTVTVTKGKSLKVSTKYVTSKTKVKIYETKKSKKIARLTWNKKQKKVIVSGKKAGKVKVTIRFRVSSKTYRKALTVKVKNPAKQTAVQTPTSTTSPVVTAPTTTPVPTPVKTPRPTPRADEPYKGDNSLPIKDIYADYFMVGAAINGSSLETMALNHRGMTDILEKHFNSTVLSNLMKPDSLLDQSASKASADGMPVCTFETCDPALEFCKEKGIKMRGHTLLWHNQTPSWFFYEDYDTSKKLVDSATMEKRMESYIAQVMGHCQDNYPGVIYCWDVVNECICVDAGSYIVTKGGWKLRASTLTDNDFAHDEAISNYWYTVMGETYVEKAFTYARKYADEGVKLFYNDYNVFQVEKRDNIYMMVDELKQKGIIDGIGLQPTVGMNYPTLNSDSDGSFKQCLEKYAKLGLELQVTELSFKLTTPATTSFLEDQAKRYGEFMQLLIDMDSDNGGPCNITSVTVFGICDDYPLYTNSKQNLYLWSKYCEPKPCFYSFIQPGLDLLAKKNNQ